MDIAARPPRARPGRARAGATSCAASSPTAPPSGAVYDSGDYHRVPRAGARARRLRRARGAEQARRAGRLGIGIACIVEPSRLEHGLHHARPDRRGARRRRCRSRGTSRACTITIGPHGGITVRITTTPQGQGHRTVAAQIVGRRARRRARGDRRASSDGHLDQRVVGLLGRLLVALLAASPRERASALAGRPRRRQGRGDPRAPRRGRVAAPASPASATGTRVAARRAWSRGSATVTYYAAPSLQPPDEDDRVTSSAVLRLRRRRRASSRSTRATGRGARPRLRDRARRRTPAEPADRRRPGARRVRARRRASRSSSASATTRTATS